MPEIRYYTVIQERQVKVSAASPLEAALLASEAFASGKGVADEKGSTSEIRDRDLVIREDY